MKSFIKNYSFSDSDSQLILIFKLSKITVYFIKNEDKNECISYDELRKCYKIALSRQVYSAPIPEMVTKTTVRFL